MYVCVAFFKNIVIMLHLVFIIMSNNMYVYINISTTRNIFNSFFFQKQISRNSQRIFLIYVHPENRMKSNWFILDFLWENWISSSHLTANYNIAYSLIITYVLSFSCFINNGYYIWSLGKTDVTYQINCLVSLRRREGRKEGTKETH